MKKNRFILFVVAISILFVYVTVNIYSNPNTNITISSSNRGLLIGTNDRTVKIFVPSRNLRAENDRVGGGQNNPNYFYFTDRNVRGISVPLHFSGWLLPIENFRHNHIAEFWMDQFSLSQILNYEIRDFGNWTAFLYDVPVPEEFKDVHSSHMRASLFHGDTWIDLHLSITDRRSSEYLHNILFEYLKTVQIQE